MVQCSHFSLPPATKCYCWDCYYSDSCWEKSRVLTIKIVNNYGSLTPQKNLTFVVALMWNLKLRTFAESLLSPVFLLNLTNGQNWLMFIWLSDWACEGNCSSRAGLDISSVRIELSAGGCKGSVLTLLARHLTGYLLSYLCRERVSSLIYISDSIC